MSRLFADTGVHSGFAIWGFCFPPETSINKRKTQENPRKAPGLDSLVAIVRMEAPSGTSAPRTASPPAAPSAPAAPAAASSEDLRWAVLQVLEETLQLKYGRSLEPRTKK